LKLVVDEGVDVYDEAEVWWAMAGRRHSRNLLK
jgi:3-polyprenyl-4-hydroxybenzoate decarboxylase